MKFRVVNLFIGLLICILLISNNSSHVTGQQCPVDAQILSSGSGWCSGSAVIGNDTLHYDHDTITFLTLGVANLDTISHSLSQFILAIKQ